MVLIDGSNIYCDKANKQEVIKDLMLGICGVIVDYSKTNGVSLVRATEIVLRYINTVVTGAIILTPDNAKESAAE